MADSTKSTDNPRKPRRDDRLGEALRANLQKRKTQSRARRAGAEDRRPEGLASGPQPGDPPVSDR